MVDIEKLFLEKLPKIGKFCAVFAVFPCYLPPEKSFDNFFSKKSSLTYK